MRKRGFILVLLGCVVCSGLSVFPVSAEAADTSGGGFPWEGHKVNQN
ncbi:hypothetical protein NQ117_12935 [Paenibacillus sp. SC116]|nr:hypothetical protein [Paenibacillus sp. SC116]MCR8844589.1 hypothetical protein [Paenibacillus sp. SC116]